MLVSNKSLFRKCYGEYAIAAINVWSMEQIHSLFRAAEKAQAPFIVQMTPVAMDFGHAIMLLSMISAAAEIYPKTIYSIHLDHGNRKAALEAISSGEFSSIMIDASHETYEKNVQITSEIVEIAHANNIEVEAELGVLSGVEEGMAMKPEDTKYTQPEEVEDFVSKTGCDSLAVAVGTSHGAYKFSGNVGLQFGILKEIQKRLPGFPLALHGGSEVSENEIHRINASGGKLGIGARGVSSDEIRKAIKYGICKINIATDARIIWTRVHREFFMESPEQLDPIIPGNTYIKELEKFYMDKFDLLKATNRTKDLTS